jgi:protein arginine kinase activator
MTKQTMDSVATGGSGFECRSSGIFSRHCQSSAVETRETFRMKKCRRCSKSATLHITELRQGEATEIHLCETCAKDYLSQAEEASTPDGDLQFDQLEENDQPEISGIDDRVCPNCGITFREFRTQGRLGCPHDYVVFESDLIPLIENIHGETQHCGKLPRRAPDSSRKQHQLIRLRSELKLAVEDEDYETAARLRDEIQEVESQLQGNDTSEE